MVTLFQSHAEMWMRDSGNKIVHTSSLVIDLQSISVTYCFIPEVIVVEISIEDSVIPTCPSCVGYIPNSLRQARLCQH